MCSLKISRYLRLFINARSKDLFMTLIRVFSHVCRSVQPCYLPACHPKSVADVRPKNFPRLLLVRSYRLLKLDSLLQQPGPKKFKLFKIELIYKVKKFKVHPFTI